MRVFILFLFLIPKAHAVNYDITVMQDYACFGVDGIPIPKNTPVASECCKNGYLKMPPSERCLAGFASIFNNSVDNIDDGFEFADDDQELEKKYDGNKVDLAGNPIINQTGPQSTVVSESVAAIAGNSGVNPRGGGRQSGSAVQSALSALKSMTGFGKGSGGSSGSSSSGGLDGASSSGGSASGSDAKGVSDGTSGKDANGGYARTGAGAGGSGDSSSGGSSGDRDSSSSVAVNSRMGEDVDLSDATNGKDALGTNGGEDADADRDPSASATDPEDYFKRIDKTASIFKIVSNRYLKKKSLWKEGQKRAEDLKKKRI